MTQTAAAATTVPRIGGPDEVLTGDQIRGFVPDQLDATDVDGRRVCVLVPDGTRSVPLPLLLSAVHGALHGRVSRLTALVALGTHAAMSETGLADHLGYEAGESAERYPSVTVLNHASRDPSAFADVGTITEDRIAELSESAAAAGAGGGRLRDRHPRPGRPTKRGSCARRDRDAGRSGRRSPAGRTRRPPAAGGPLGARPRRSHRAGGRRAGSSKGRSSRWRGRQPGASTPALCLRVVRASLGSRVRT